MAANEMKYVSSDNLNFVIAKVKAELARKQDTAVGKDLSTNDFTNDLKVKLESMIAGAQENVIEEIEVNGVRASIVSKTASITVPTKLSDLVNDNETVNKTYVNQAINNSIANVTQFSFDIVTELPDTGDIGTIYLLKHKGSKETDEHYEYIWTGETYEMLGTTDIDLSGYVKKEELTPLTDSEIDNMWNPNSLM